MRILYSLLLIGVTVVWGWTFVVVQEAIVLYGVLGFLAVRFVLAAAALAPQRRAQDFAPDPHGRRGRRVRSGSRLPLSDHGDPVGVVDSLLRPHPYRALVEQHGGQLKVR